MVFHLLCIFIMFFFFFFSRGGGGCEKSVKQIKTSIDLLELAIMAIWEMMWFDEVI